MEQTKTVFATVSKTFFGREDHGILTFYLDMWVDTSYCTYFGGYALDGYDAATNSRVFTTKGLEAMSEILKVFGVNSWEQLKGRQIKVVDHGWPSSIDEIVSLDGERRFNIREFFGNGKETN